MRGGVPLIAEVVKVGTSTRAGARVRAGHDYEHDLYPTGKKPSEIVYAYVADVSADGYLVRYQDEPIEFDLTEGLTEFDGILVYDAGKLERVSKNELWFKSDPRDALMLVFKVRSDDEDEGNGKDQ
jgi:hypothetical protein